MPQTEIYFCKNVKINNNNQYYQTDDVARQNYFTGRTTASTRLTNQSFQRVGKGSCKVNLSYDELLGCTYMMFRNLDKSDKWFYAFINRIEYINDNNVEVFYTIDHWQTWYFQGCTLGQCHVERSHTPDDVVGKYTLSEPVDTGEMVLDNLVRENVIHDVYQCLLCNIVIEDLPTVTPATGAILNGQYVNVLQYVYANADDLDAAIKKLNDNGQIDSIIALYTLPRNLFLNQGNPGAPIQFSVNKQITTLGDYTPKCKKLLSYPFNTLNVFVPGAVDIDYPYELFSENEISFVLSGTTLPSPEAVFTPQNYKGQPNNTAETFSVSGWPMCSYSSDLYTSYLAQNYNTIQAQQTSMALNMTFGSIGAALGAAINPALGGLGLIENVAGNISQAMTYEANFRDLEHKPPANRGSMSTNAIFSSGYLDVYTAQKHVKREVAEVIDNYLNEFGYRIETTMTPVLNQRPHWTYVKTTNAICWGEAPAEALRLIEQDLNRGMRFWNDEQEIGNYTLDNSPA